MSSAKKPSASTARAKESTTSASGERHVVEIARGPGDETGDAMAAASHAAPSDVSGQGAALAASGHQTEANAAPLADSAGPPQDAPPTGEEE